MSSLTAAWQLSSTADHGLVLTTRTRPVPAPDGVVLRVLATSLNYRDLSARKGRYGGGAAINPIVPLSDGVGEVVEVGAMVVSLKVGDRVAGGFMPGWVDGGVSEEKQAVALGGGTSDGMLAEYVVLPANGVVKVPAYLSDAEAATLPCAAVTAWNALFHTNHVKPGDTVLLLGTGGVSLFALQLARIAGARVILTSKDEAKLVRARELGAHETINYATNPDWPDRVLALTGGRGVDLAIDVAGGNVLNQIVRCTRRGGAVALIGVLGGYEAPVTTVQILMRSIRVSGIYVGSIALFQDLLKTCELHLLRPVIDQVFPFSEAPAAYAHLESGRHFGKVVIAGKERPARAA